MRLLSPLVLVFGLSSAASGSYIPDDNPVDQPGSTGKFKAKSTTPKKPTRAPVLHPWASLVAVDYQKKAVHGVSEDLPDGGVLLRQVGEKGGWNYYAPPSGLPSGVITEVRVHFGMQQVHYVMQVDGLSMERLSESTTLMLGGQVSSVILYQVEIKLPALSCWGTPASDVARAYVKALSAVNVICTP